MTQKPAKKDHVVGGLLLCSIVVLVFAFFYLRQSWHDTQGESNSDCEQFPISPIFNNHGWEISGHITGCSPPAASVAYYLYVRPRGEKDDLKYMVLRYADAAGKSEPDIKWVDEKTVLVSVKIVQQITWMRHSAGPIKIIYDIGSEQFPREE